MNPRIEKLKWRSRRSMLELDLYFNTFIENGKLDLLSEKELDFYASLLEFDDGEILLLFQKKITTHSENIQKLIDSIINTNHNKV